MQTSGDQRREIAKLYRRHCERSEAIHLSTCRAMDCFAALAMTWSELASLLHPEEPAKRPSVATGEPNGIAHETGWKFERTECRILQCSKTIRADPSNGQWQFGRLVCNGASGMQASEGVHAFRGNNGRKHA
ncbi:MAG TPA: hypothetical protein VMT08_16490 [Bradyrhizobium sp.]|nr:hypothetical protein [Bradyrhizobium sp.]